MIAVKFRSQLQTHSHQIYRCNVRRQQFAVSENQPLGFVIACSAGRLSTTKHQIRIVIRLRKLQVILMQLAFFTSHDAEFVRVRNFFPSYPMRAPNAFSWVTRQKSEIGKIFPGQAGGAGFGNREIAAIGQSEVIGHAF